MSFRVVSSSRLVARSPGNPCNGQKTYGSRCWSSQPKQWKIAISYSHEWYVKASLIFSSLKIGKLTFTLIPLPGHAGWLLSSTPSHGWLLWTLITSPIGTPTPRRGWTTRCAPRKLWSSLPSALPTTSTGMLRMSVSSLRPVENCIAISHHYFGNIFFHASHPLYNVIWHGEGPHYLCHSVGTSWPPGLSSPFYNSVHNGSATLLYSIFGHLYLSCPTAQLIKPIKLNPTSLVFSKESPSLCDYSSKIVLPPLGQGLQLW